MDNEENYSLDCVDLDIEFELAEEMGINE